MRGGAALDHRQERARLEYLLMGNRLFVTGPPDVGGPLNSGRPPLVRDSTLHFRQGYVVLPQHYPSVVGGAGFGSSAAIAG